MGKDQWQGAIEALLQEDAPAEIALESEYDETHGTTSITYNLRVFNPEDDDYYFSLVLIEDDIVSPQKNSNPNVGETPIIHDYHHRHVLRGDINGIWGEQVDIAAGNQVTGTHTYTLSGEWEPENCSIIGYLYRNSTKEILHAAGVQVNE